MRYLLLALLLFATSAAALPSTRVAGEVVAIGDGDTLTLLTSEQRQLKVRLAQIDTPEKRQPYGNRARQALADKVFRRRVEVEIETVDRYGRQVGTVWLQGRDINAEMVAEGHAWAYRQYLSDPALLDLEQRARRSGRGLWGLPEFERVPPWEWRRGQRGITVAGGGPRCGRKRYCAEMQSCAEARFYLSQCGAALDGDGDGLPCEALCR